MKIQQVKNRTIIENKFYKEKADKLKPNFNKNIIHPISIIEMTPDVNEIHGWKSNVVEPAADLKGKDFGKGDTFILDFGKHLVGYLTTNIKPVGSPPDAPLHLRLTFGEMPVEVAEPFSNYNGWISSSWLQEEMLHVDVLPEVLSLPRRYSFRYVKVEVLDTSAKYRVSFEDIYCNTVTSADSKNVVPLNSSDKELNVIDQS